MAEPKCRKCKQIKIEFDKLTNFEKPSENVVSQLVIVPSAVYPAQPVQQRVSDRLRGSILVSTYYGEIKGLHFKDLCLETERHVQTTDVWVKNVVGVPSSLSCIAFAL